MVWMLLLTVEARGTLGKFQGSTLDGKHEATVTSTKLYFLFPFDT
jgi:hypothetical protein